jgi:hypothetical protein
MAGLVRQINEISGRPNDKDASGQEHFPALSSPVCDVFSPCYGHIQAYSS